MNPDNMRFWLTGVKYLEGKRAIIAEFSQLNTRRMARHSFFPSFFVSRKEISLAQLKEILGREKTRFKIEQIGNAYQVLASTFSSLQGLANALFKETGFRPLVLEPERQFLLEKDLHYFDCFTLGPENCFEKSSLFHVPETRLLFFSEPLHETLRLLLEEDGAIAKKTVELIALSRILRIPLSKLPGSRFMQLETLLENIFFEAWLGKRKPIEEGFSLQCNAVKECRAQSSVLSSDLDLLFQQAFLDVHAALVKAVQLRMRKKSAFFSQKPCSAIELIRTKSR